MKKPLLAVIVLLAHGFIVRTSPVLGAGPQCEFDHPYKTGKISLSLVQAFMPTKGICFGGAVEGDTCTADADCAPGVCRSLVGRFPIAPRPANAITEGGVPSYAPPKTFDQQYDEDHGYPLNGWSWVESKGNGSVSFQASKNKLIVPAMPEDSADVMVQFKIKGVRDGLVAKAAGNGSVWAFFRLTFKDRAKGDMTVEDFALDFGFVLAAGQAKKKTTLCSERPPSSPRSPG